MKKAVISVLCAILFLAMNLSYANDWYPPAPAEPKTKNSLYEKYIDMALVASYNGNLFEAEEYLNNATKVFYDNQKSPKSQINVIYTDLESYRYYACDQYRIRIMLFPNEGFNEAYATFRQGGHSDFLIIQKGRLLLGFINALNTYGGLCSEEFKGSDEDLFDAEEMTSLHTEIKNVVDAIIKEARQNPSRSAQTRPLRSLM